jgi:hypothetical protein
VIADPVLLEQLRHQEVERNRLYLEQARILREIAGPHRISQVVSIESDCPMQSTTQVSSTLRTITIDDGIREQVAVHLRWSFTESQRRIDHARLLYGPLSETAQALHAGKISVDHATVICNAAAKHSLAWQPDTDTQQQFIRDCAHLQNRVLPIAVESTVSRTKSAADKALERIDSEGQRERRRSQRLLHDISIIDEGDGRALLLARMGILEAQACAAAIRAHAGSEKFADLCDPQGNALPAGRTRIAALIDLLVCSRSAVAGAGTTLTAQVDLVIDLNTLIGLQEAMGTCTQGNRTPFQVAGSDIRDFLSMVDCDLTLRRLVTDPLRGHLLDLGRTRYTPGAELRRLIQARDITCRFPGCNRSAKGGEIDHAQEWNRGGETSAANLGALCTRHHQLKTHGGWSIVASDANGSCTWRAPHGVTYSVPPNSQAPDPPTPEPPTPEPPTPEPPTPEPPTPEPPTPEPPTPEPPTPDNSDPPF